MKSVILAVALAYMHAANGAPPAQARPAGKAQREGTAANASVPDTIGSATMLEDRTLVLSLIYWFPGGGHTTPAEFRYKPGEMKGVKPWTTTPDPQPNVDGPLPAGFKDYDWPKEGDAPGRP